MNMISQLPQPARFKSVGERRLPVQVPIVTYTLAERVQNAKIENAMRAQKVTPPPLPPSNINPEHRSLKRGDANRAAILAALDTPKYARQISNETGLKMSTVYTITERMCEQGLIKKGDPVRIFAGCQHRWGYTWVRA